MPIYTRLSGGRFFIRHRELAEGNPAEKSVTKNGFLYATPAFLCLMVIETSDIAFSFDSVPAVISVTQEPLLVYAAMIFAILGLRTLYFVIAALNRYLAHLEKAVIALLFFIAAKMALQSWNHVFGDTGIHISPGQSLLVVLGTLLLGLIASLDFPEKGKEAALPAESD
jgi:tellurite resistance protein TerC